MRVEAGWDRSDPRAAAVNRFRLDDAALDAGLANVAASIVNEVGGSVADAHIGAVARSVTDDVVVLTSDPGDIMSVSGPKPVTIVRI